MKTIEQALSEIESAPAPANLREHSRAVGDVAMQGDIYLTRVPNTWPRGKLLGTRKIAVGEGEGSNHIVEGNVNVYEGKKLPNGFVLPEGAQVADLLGPLVEVVSEAVLTHPRHAHHALEVGCDQVTYQWDMMTAARVLD